MAAPNDSDTEIDGGGLVRVFDLPSQNATPRELHEVSIFQLTLQSELSRIQVIKTLQLETGRLAAENRDLRTKLDAVTEKAASKKQTAKGPDILGYQEVVKMLGKKFGFMHEPWINSAAFTALPANPPANNTPAEIDAMFKSSKLYLQYITSALYGHIPAKYHELVDSSTFPDFGDNVSVDMHQA